MALVTGFSGDLYDASGRGFLDSYREHGGAMRLLVGYESLDHLGRPSDLPERLALDYPDLQNDPRVIWVDLSTQGSLTTFLRKHRGIIPTYLGGQALPCTCPGQKERHAKHRPRCHYSWMNRNTSRWFRKVVAQKAAAERFVMPRTRWLFWLDVDCQLLQEIPAPVAQGLLGGADVMHLKAWRRASETGVIGFDLAQRGTAVIDSVLGLYTSGRFLTQNFWDDCATFDRALTEGRFQAFDLAARSLKEQGLDKGQIEARRQGKRPITEVIPYTPLAAYLTHDKGRHGRKMGLMT